jgi:hypothetical protein
LFLYIGSDSAPPNIIYALLIDIATLFSKEYVRVPYLGLSGG